MSSSSFTWRRPVTEGPVPSARGGHTTSLVATDLVVFGGHYYSGGGTFVYMDDTCVLDLETNTWHAVRTGGDSPPGRYAHTATVVEGRIFVFGGRGASGALFNDVYFLDAASWCWVRVSSTTQGPAGRFGHAATLVGNKIVVSGGWDGKRCFDDLWIFDTSNYTWVKPRIGGRVPRPRHGHSLSLTPDGRLLVFGGFGFENGAPAFYGDVWQLDTETMVWSRPRVEGDFPVGRYGHSACMMGAHLVCYGGWSGPSNEHQSGVALDTSTMRWGVPAVGGKVPDNRYGHGTVQAGVQIIAFGGWGGNRALNELYVAELGGVIATSVDEYEEAAAEDDMEDYGDDAASFDENAVDYGSDQGLQ